MCNYILIYNWLEFYYIDCQAARKNAFQTRLNNVFVILVPICYRFAILLFCLGYA